MLLNNCELIPGVVQSSKDPENLGRIKCVIPGVIDSETMSLENMPWAYPLGMAHYQSFSKPIEGQKVWVLINKSNYNEYWYLPFFEYNDKTKEYLNSGVYENDNPLIKGTIMIVGDSFAGAILPYLARTFERVVNVGYGSKEKGLYQKIMTEYKPQWVVHELIERYFISLSSSDKYVNNM